MCKFAEKRAEFHICDKKCTIRAGTIEIFSRERTNFTIIHVGGAWPSLAS
jgi:hypothetical protein